MSKGIAIHWFRQDLRLTDNLSLEEAAEFDAVLPIYILDDENSQEFKMGSASRWWLHHSLQSLNESLDSKLSIYNQNPKNVIKKLLEKYDVKAVFWNRCYEPWRIDRDIDIKAYLDDKKIENKSILIQQNQTTPKAQ